ncbi:MAG: hypothetical protein KFF73_19200 [Cyclobacteriaceae bacterium]|nr:hypothetical protein [Cyclobacteriaceae bacterium]
MEIVEYLIENGARPNIFTMAMLGEYEIVKRWIQKYPPILTSRGPHGFSLLHHAEMAGNNSDLLSQYLRSEGLTTVKFS